jgi:hypothetical protein
LHIAHAQQLAIANALDRQIIAQPRSQNANAVHRRKICLAPGLSVIRVRVGYHGPIYRAPWIDIEVSRRAKQT